MGFLGADLRAILFRPAFLASGPKLLITSPNLTFDFGGISIFWGAIAVPISGLCDSVSRLAPLCKKAVRFVLFFRGELFHHAGAL